ncbi:hypothetical protein TWF751_000420 [Orbilia oligospora]|nr:hypothetical protein TWF751_000420 [Orbilia oligospora]
MYSTTTIFSFTRLFFSLSLSLGHDHIFFPFQVCLTDRCRQNNVLAKRNGTVTRVQILGIISGHYLPIQTPPPCTPPPEPSARPVLERPWFKLSTVVAPYKTQPEMAAGPSSSV